MPEKVKETRQKMSLVNIRHENMLDMLNSAADPLHFIDCIRETILVGLQILHVRFKKPYAVLDVFTQTKQ